MVVRLLVDDCRPYCKKSEKRRETQARPRESVPGFGGLSALLAGER